MRKRRILFALLIAGVFLLCAALTACGSSRVLPEGGYDYRVRPSGVLLGYPIPRRGENGYQLKAEDEPSAFVYEKERDTYVSLPIKKKTVFCADGVSVSARFTEYRGEKTYFSQAESAEGTVCTVYEGAYRDKAVASYASRLLLCTEDGWELVSNGFLSLCEIYGDRILFLTHVGARIFLCSYEDDICVTVWEADNITDAWYAVRDGAVCVVFRADDTWYIKEDRNAPVPAADPFGAFSDAEAAEYSVFVLRGSVFALCGDNDSMWFVSLVSGEPFDIDMGGIFRFDRQPQDAHAALLPLSPDRQYAFLTDFDCLYRMCLADGTYSVILNEAPTYENTCPISSCTAADDSHLLLSQASAEYTEFVAVITEGVFSEDIPEQRHEHEKIDLDNYPTSEEPQP